ncbi:MAG: RlpA-like double-psi beta-barrel domain-containing protein [Actinomycetota bacterium]
MAFFGYNKSSFFGRGDCFILLRLFKKNIGKIFFLTLFFLLVSNPPVFSQNPSSGNASEVDGLSDPRLDETIQKYNAALNELDQIDLAIDRRERELESLDRSLAQSLKIFEKRVSGIYKHGGINAWLVLLGSEDINDFTQRLELLTRIGKQDLAVVRKIEKDKKEVEEESARLKTQKEIKRQLLIDLTAERYRIEAELRERREALNRVKANVSSTPSSSTPVYQRSGRSQEGTATWYVYTGAMTAAHNTLPMGTKVLVTNLSNGKQIWVEIVDRGIYSAAIIDLEKVAFAQLADPSEGVIYVKIEW